MATEMTPLKATIEPILMRARRQAMTLVKATAYTGIEVLSLTYSDVSTVDQVAKFGPYLAESAPAGKAPRCDQVQKA